MGVTTAVQTSTPIHAVQRRVLNVGSGAGRLKQPYFEDKGWTEIRFDIDAAAKPDVIGSISDLGSLFVDSSFDAVWSSHSLEHLARHEVPAALSAFHRIIKPDGFVIIRCPDLEVVCKLLLQHGPDCIGYVSPAGPITPIDMLYGHSMSIENGKPYMAHGTGFTGPYLAKLLLAAGFETVATKTDFFDLWALAAREEADFEALCTELSGAGIDFARTPA